MAAADLIKRQQQPPAAGADPQPPAQQDELPLAKMIRRAIEIQEAQFRAVLPNEVDPGRFARLVLTAVKATPKLTDCFSTDFGRASVLLAAMQAAAVGLEPNTITQDCWLQPRRAKDPDGPGGRDAPLIDACELSIGYRGYVKLARRSQITVHAEVVREHDRFRYQRGLDHDVFDFVKWEEMEGEEHDKWDGPGALLRAYSLARFPDGGYQFTLLTKADVLARRASSPSFQFAPATSPWTKFEPSMWRKSAIRAQVPLLALSAEAMRLVQSDEAGPLRWNDDTGVIEARTWDEQQEDLGLPATTGTPDDQPPPAPPAAEDQSEPAVQEPPAPQERERERVRVAAPRQEEDAPRPVGPDGFCPECQGINKHFDGCPHTR